MVRFGGGGVRNHILYVRNQSYNGGGGEEWMRGKHSNAKSAGWNSFDYRSESYVSLWKSNENQSWLQIFFGQYFGKIVGVLNTQVEVDLYLN